MERTAVPATVRRFDPGASRYALAVSVGSVVTALTIALLSVLPVFDSSLQWTSQLRFFGGVLGSAVAGALAWDRTDTSQYRSGAKSGAYASIGGLVLFYGGGVAFAAASRFVATGQLPRAPLTLFLSGLSTVVLLLPGYLLVGIAAGVGGNLAWRGKLGPFGTALRELASGETTSRRPDKRAAEPDVTLAEVEAARERALADPDGTDFGPLIGWLGAPDRAVRSLAVRTIAAVPGDALDDVSPALAALLGRLDGDAHRKTLRGVAHVARKRPDAVKPVVADVATFLTAYHVAVRDNAAAALRAVVTAHPEVAPVVFPYLSGHPPEVRDVAFSILADVAEESPESVALAVPQILGALDDERVDTGPLARLLASVAGRTPRAVAPAMDDLLAWADGDGDRAEHRDEAVLAAARVAGDDAESGERAVPALVGYLADSGGAHRDEVARALVAVARAAPGAREAVVAACRECDEWGRLNVARALAGLDRPAATGLVDAVLAEDDTYRDRLVR